MSVAPFCFGDASYWKQFAHEPVRIGELAESEDFSYPGYLRTLLGMVPSTTRVEANEQGTVTLTFSALPSLDLVRAIASLPQTHRIRRVSDSELRIPDPPGPVNA